MPLYFGLRSLTLPILLFSKMLRDEQVDFVDSLP